MVRLAGSLQKSTEVMQAMSKLIKVPEIAATMRDMSREMMKVRLQWTFQFSSSRKKIRLNNFGLYGVRWLLIFDMTDAVMFMNVQTFLLVPDHHTKFDGNIYIQQKSKQQLSSFCGKNGCYRLRPLFVTKLEFSPFTALNKIKQRQNEV